MIGFDFVSHRCLYSIASGSLSVSAFLNTLCRNPKVSLPAYFSRFLPESEFTSAGEELLNYSKSASFLFSGLSSHSADALIHFLSYLLY